LSPDPSIAPHAAKLLESDRSVLVVATVDPSRRPHAVRAWGLQVVRGGRLRLLISSDDIAALADLDATAAIAVTATDVATLESVQAKGRAETPSACTADDRAMHDAYRDAVYRTIHETDGSSLDLLERMSPRDVVAVEMVADELYDQTPGPSAGRRLVGGAS
jgi:hypothetical protein